MAEGRPSEPLLNAPWPALLVVAAIPLSYLVQRSAPDPDAFTLAYALRSTEVEGGRWLGLLTSMFLHGNWAHALANAGFALPFGTAVARLLGPSLPRAIAFFAFYLLCGLAGGLAHVLFNPGDPAPVVGASGAVSGLMGAGARLIQQRRDGRVGGVFGPFVIALTVIYVAINLVFGSLGFSPDPDGAGIAWEAHLGGYFAGLLLIGPWARLFAEKRRAPETPLAAGPWGSANEGS